MIKELAIILTMAGIAFSGADLSAEEGGSGHYMPGSMASFVDGVPSSPTVIARLNYVYYDGSTEADRAIPIAGMTALDVDASSSAVGLTLLWAPDLSLGEKWNFAMSATIPLINMKVSADVQSSVFGNSLTVRRSDTESGLGDIILMPVMVNYTINEDLNTNFRIAAYAPTGNYEVGRLANTGKNFWTIEPTAALMYLGQKNGIEASVFFGMDFNQENEDTSYQSGVQAHLDATFAQHFPLWSGLAGAGVTGFWYQQVTDDSGEGANFGDFRARANGVGPVISYAGNAAGIDIIAELKWLHEFDNEKRLEGDTIFFKILGKF